MADDSDKPLIKFEPITKYDLSPAADAKNYALEESDYTGPEEAADIALRARKTRNIQFQYAKKVARTFGRDLRNKTAQKLIRVMERQGRAHTQLSLIGYTMLRHLQAEGLTLPEIARDLDLNVLDVYAYMGQHPDVLRHAQLDARACADSKVTDFLYRLEHEPPKTKFAAERMMIEYKVLLEQVKRISPDWAEWAKAPQDKTQTAPFQMNVILNGVQMGSGEIDVVEGEVVKEEITTVEEVMAREPGPIEGPESPVKDDYYTAAPPLDSDGVYQDPLSSPPHKKKILEYDFDS